jgi:hypothetical protein
MNNLNANIICFFIIDSYGIESEQNFDSIRYWLNQNDLEKARQGID